MNCNRLLIRKVAVLGAGVMGAQIAAHFANADFEVMLFDLASPGDDPDAGLKKSFAFLQKIEPSAFATEDKKQNITLANFRDKLAFLADCDLVIEAVSENLEIKLALYKQVTPFIASHTVFVTNTSGLSIAALAKGLPPEFRKRFCGAHFFNPPRYMPLLELISQTECEAGLLDALETFFTTFLGKKIIRAPDTPNFIANRMGVFATLVTLVHTERFALGFDVVDALTGPLIGRPKSATYRTLDVVGLDTFSSVVKTMANSLPNDPWHFLFQLPEWLITLLNQGFLGQKTGCGIYRKEGKEIFVFDVAQNSYRPSRPVASAEVTELLNLENPAERYEKLSQCMHPEARFVLALLHDLFHYCAYHLKALGCSARDVDLALRLGYGWQMGPFELWQTFGWNIVQQGLSREILAEKTLSSVSLPAWVTESRRAGVHFLEGSYSPSTGRNETRRKLPVYKKQLFPEKVCGEGTSYGSAVFENEGVRLWSLDSEIGILSFKSKNHVIGNAVLDGVLEAVKQAETRFQGLVLWQTEPPFSFGANLLEIAKAVEQQNHDLLKQTVKKFQQASLALRHSLIPAVAAVRGMALGGGCEFIMHCAKTVAALETSIGLVEVGVGLLPAGGGCKEFARRASEDAKQGRDLFTEIKRFFQTIAMGQVSRSALHAKDLGYLRPSDTVVFHPDELLFAACSEVKNLCAAGWRPPMRSKSVQVVGRGGIATLKAGLLNMLEGRFISEHDYEICCKIATVLCGGDLDEGSLVSENWLLELEAELFCELLRHPKTQERIEFMLKNGKALRN